MENRFFSNEDIKEKFALLIAKLHDAGFLSEYINQVILESSFFDCFENNNIDEFMSLSFETITEKVFRREVVFDYYSELSSEFYWAGSVIFELLSIYHIPLKRVLLVCPLIEVVEKYNPYHEMHIEQFYYHYLELEKQRSVVKILREEKGLSLSRISFLTDINISSLKKYDGSNSALFGTSFLNLTKLANLLDISIDAFKGESSFCYINFSMFNNEEFKSLFVKTMIQYFNFDPNEKYEIIDAYKSSEEFRKLLLKNKYLVDISHSFGLLYMSSNRIIPKYLSNSEMHLMYQKVIDCYNKLCLS